MKAAKLEICFPSTLEVIKPIIKDILYFIQNNLEDCDSDTLFDLRLIYNELLINSVLHGNKEDASKNVKVRIVTNRQNLIYSSICDEGSGFNYQDILMPNLSSDGLFLERGRGIHLVSSLSDRIRFNHKGNRIVFFKRVKKDG